MRLRAATCIAVLLAVAGTMLVGTPGFAGSPPPFAGVGLGDFLPPVGTQPPVDPGPIVAGFESKGYVSYYRYTDPAFHGGCVAIRDETNWSAFWAVHTRGIWPEPPTPAIDFGEELVLVCVFGTTTDCCGSYVNITAVERDGDGYSVSVDFHYQSGMMTMLSNPYHIKAVTRTDGPVKFHLLRPWGPPVPEIPPVP